MSLHNLTTFKATVDHRLHETNVPKRPRGRPSAGSRSPSLVGRRGTPHEVVGLSRKGFGSLQQSGSILIDSQGIVRHAHGATLPTGGYDKKGITAAVQALRA